LLKVAKKEDLVILKLDIDTPRVETALIQDIISTNSISELIDVLFFEDHINTEEMKPIFGPRLTQTLRSSLESFIAMRQKGIRAHPWV